jgi:PAS domain S-box-containing protein
MKTKRSWTFGSLLALTVALVSATLCLLAVHSLDASRLDKVRQAEVHTQNLAQALDSNISAEAHAIDMVLVTVASELERSLASGRLDLPRMERFIAAQEKLLPGVVAMAVSDAAGTVLRNHPIGVPRSDLRDRPFWTPLRDHPDAGLFITKPLLGVPTRKWVITFARPYHFPDGRFGGVVVAPVLVDHFQKLLTEFNVGTGGRLRLLDNESGFVAGSPPVLQGETNEVSSELQRIIASGVQQVTYGVAPLDRMKRVSTFRRIHGAPLFALASLAEADFLAQWRDDRRNVYVALGISIFGLLTLALFLWQFWLGRERDADALSASRKHYRNLVENTPDLVTRVDLEGRLVFVNHTSLPIYGLTPEACLGQLAFDFIAAEDRERTRSAFASWLKSDQDVFEHENRQVGVDGQVHIMSWLIWAERDETAKVVGFASNARDITKQHQAEVAIRQSEQDYRHLFEMANDPILIFEPETELILEANQSACGIYGFQHDELVGLDLKTLTKDVPSGNSQIEALLASGQYHNFETIQRNKQGEEIHFLINSSVITYRGRKAILSLNRDIGYHKRLEARVSQAQKLDSLGTLAGGVAHDMNNVLGAILGLASAHLATQPPGSPLHQAFDTICKASERGGKMIKSLLGFARQSPAETSRLDLNAIVQEQVALLERTTLAKVRLEIDLEADLRPMLGDASALTHAFMNLCVNAVDAMADNGILILHTRNVDSDWIEVVVEDNGMGMSKEVLGKAMEPFFTTKETGKGTGLGLSLVFSTVKAHRGQMAIESEPDKGTRVLLRFPACERESPVQATAPAVSEEAVGPSGSMKVLLVDDDDLIQSSLQAILEVLGCTAVTTAQSGEEALAKLEAGLVVDLVILDMNMPGLGGFGTLPRLRVLRPEVPVLLATGRVDQAALTLASAHPGVTLLAKPFGLRELQRHIENSSR